MLFEGCYRISILWRFLMGGRIRFEWLRVDAYFIIIIMIIMIMIMIMIIIIIIIVIIIIIIIIIIICFGNGGKKSLFSKISGYVLTGH